METGTVLNRTRERLAAYTALRRQGRTPAQAADIMGVSERTAERYERRAGNAVAPRKPARRPSAADQLPVPEGGLRRGCGTYLAWLLHRVLGEAPCRVCMEAQYTRVAASETWRRSVTEFQAMRAADLAARLRPDMTGLLTLIASQPTEPPAPLLSLPPVTGQQAASNHEALERSLNGTHGRTGRPRSRRTGAAA